MPTAFPSSAPKDTRCRRCARQQGRTPAHATDRPRSPFRRRPAKSIAFPTTRMSFTITIALDRQDCSCRSRAPTPRSRGPHVVPRLGTVFGEGVASVTGRSPAGRDIRGVSTFVTRWCFVPGTDDPSTPAWLDRRGRRRRLIAPLAPCRSQRPDGFYDREPAARRLKPFHQRPGRFSPGG
jgi:hypothetical protein